MSPRRSKSNHQRKLTTNEYINIMFPAISKKKKNNTFTIISPPANCKKVSYKTMKIKSERIRIGIDLDGVLALQPMNGFWFRLRLMKEELLKKLSVNTYYLPRGNFERLIWKVINQRRKPFVDNSGLLKKFSKLPNTELYLITSRYSFMKKITSDWLKKYNLMKYFKEIIYNNGDGNPHRFKVDMVNQLHLQYFIDDDWETISALHAMTNADIIWISEQGKKAKNISMRIKTKKNLFQTLAWLLKKLR